MGYLTVLGRLCTQVLMVVEKVYQEMNILKCSFGFNDVTLSCHFTLAPEDLGGIDIEWSTKPADIQKEETVVIWYAGDHRIYNDFDHRFQSRVQFVSPDPESGNGSITINDLKLTDSDTFQCKVKKLPGISSIIIRLDVMERPTKPVCNPEVVVEMGQTVVLSCIGSQGSPPMWYTWSKESREKMLPGDLFLTITGEDVLGPYVCNAENLVGSETCTATLILKSAVSNVAVSAAVTVIVLLMIITISAIVFFCRKRKNVENFGSEIRVDELPPHKWLLKKRQQAVSSVYVQKELSNCENVFNNVHIENLSKGERQDGHPGEKQQKEV
uniref:Ig-like domain-containing protein n=1 Tax=Seriola lalandi dorsalis TaxID=1841481 RepID=A0A3B4WWV8_SERLL